MAFINEALLARIGGKELVAWHHENGTGVNAQSYRERYRKVLVEGLSGARIIYLDTNYWVRLRDAELGCGSNSATLLLQMLRAMVRSREVVCVSHFNSLLELGKQEETSLRVTARLLDELTEGISIAPMADLWTRDCGMFISAKLEIETQQMLPIWTKVGQIHQHALPEEMPGPITKAGREAVLKAMVDLFWNATFDDVFGQFSWGTKDTLNADIDPEVIARVEERKVKQQVAGQSLERVRLREFSQFVNEYLRPIFAEHLLAWNAQHGFPTGLVSVMHQLQSVVDAAVNDFTDRKLGNLLPSAAIHVDLYALYETGNPNRRLTTNDWADWNHAAAALPHCDVFMTEKHLAHQLRQELGADKQYRCTVIGTLERALAELQRLDSGNFAD
jgi:hypothetical protein